MALSPFDQNGSSSILIDQAIGQAYPIVKHVSQNIEFVKHVSSNLETIYTVWENLSIIRNASENIELFNSGFINLTPELEVTPINNGDMIFEFTNNTTITIKAKGNDGVVRSGTITLS